MGCAYNSKISIFFIRCLYMSVSSVLSFSFNSLTSNFYQITVSQITERIKEIATDVFKKICEWFRFISAKPDQMNIKVFALISCVSLIIILVVSSFCGKKTSIVIPPTPAPVHTMHSAHPRS